MILTSKIKTRILKTQKKIASKRYCLPTEMECNHSIYIFVKDRQQNNKNIIDIYIKRLFCIIF